MARVNGREFESRSVEAMGARSRASKPPIPRPKNEKAGENPRLFVLNCGRYSSSYIGAVHPVKASTKLTALLVFGSTVTGPAVAGLGVEAVQFDD